MSKIYADNAVQCVVQYLGLDCNTLLRFKNTRMQRLSLLVTILYENLRNIKLILDNSVLFVISTSRKFIAPQQNFCQTLRLSRGVIRYGKLSQCHFSYDPLNEIFPDNNHTVPFRAVIVSPRWIKCHDLTKRICSQAPKKRWESIKEIQGHNTRNARIEKLQRRQTSEKFKNGRLVRMKDNAIGTSRR